MSDIGDYRLYMGPAWPGCACFVSDATANEFFEAAGVLSAVLAGMAQQTNLCGKAVPVVFARAIVSAVAVLNWENERGQDVSNEQAVEAINESFDRVEARTDEMVEQIKKALDVVVKVQNKHLRRDMSLQIRGVKSQRDGG